MLSDAIRLWTTVEPYRSHRAANIAWRLLPAIENGQCRLFYREGRPVGLATWGFMTAAEFETRRYSGAEVFARRSGERLVFVDMIAPGGQSDVLWMCRELRVQFKRDYPGVEKIWAHRGPRTGVFPNKGG